MANFNWDQNFELNVARGKMRGAHSIHKFGAISSLSGNATGTVWDVNDTLYPWGEFDGGAIQLTIQSDPADAGKNICILGLDADYNEQVEDILLDGTSTQTTTLNFIRVYRGFCKQQLAADVEILSPTATTVMRITAEANQTLMAVYTIPAGYTGYLRQGTASAQGAAEATGFMKVRFGGQTAFNVGHTFEVVGNGGQYFYKFPYYVKIPEKSDIDVVVRARSNNGRFTAAFDILLLVE